MEGNELPLRTKHSPCSFGLMVPVSLASTVFYEITNHTCVDIEIRVNLDRSDL